MCRLCSGRPPAPLSMSSFFCPGTMRETALSAPSPACARMASCDQAWPKGWLLAGPSSTNAAIDNEGLAQEAVRRPHIT